MERVRAFVAGLPEGEASYHGALVKAGVVRTWIEGHDVQQLRRALAEYPDAVATMEAPVTTWVREVHATIVYLAVRELFFHSDGTYVRAAYDKNAALLDRPIYKPLFLTFGHERLVRWAPKVFQQFHRGTTVTVDDEGPDLRVIYRYPPGLIPPLIARCHITSIAALIEKVGHMAVLEMESHAVDRTVFNVTLAG